MRMLAELRRYAVCFPLLCFIFGGRVLSCPVVLDVSFPEAPNTLAISSIPLASDDLRKPRGYSVRLGFKLEGEGRGLQVQVEGLGWF